MLYYALYYPQFQQLVTSDIPVFPIRLAAQSDKEWDQAPKSSLRWVAHASIFRRQ